MHKIDLLKKHYDDFINEKDQRSFLLGLYHYIEFILNDDELKILVTDLEKVKKALIDEKDVLESRVAKEEEESLSALKDLKKILGVETPKNLTFDKQVLSESYPQFDGVKNRIDKEQEIELWGVWDKLHALYLEFKAKPNKKHDVVSYAIFAKILNTYLYKMLSQCSSASVDSKVRETSEAKSEGKKDELPKVESIVIVTENEGTRNNRAWLVFNNNFEHKVEVSLKASGYMAELFDIAYKQGSGKVAYDHGNATSINSTLFNRKGIKNVYRQTTIVRNNDGYYEIDKDVKVSILPVGRLDRDRSKYFPSRSF